MRRLSWLVAGLALAAASPAAAAAPDLIVDTLTVDPTSGPNGSTVAISATIKNQGDAEAPASVARIRINQSPTSVGPTDDALCNSLATPVLAPGASAELSCSPRISGQPAGASYIWAIADGNKNIGQVNTTNDRRNVQFTVDSTSADLVVDDIVVSPTQADNGDQITVTATIRNQGDDDSLDSTTRFRINQDSEALDTSDPTLCSVATSAINAGSTTKVVCKKTLSGRPPGTNYVWVVADVNNEAGQSDTDNDSANEPIEVGDQSSDLVVDSVTVDPTSAGPTKQVTVTIAVRNQGTVTASSSVTRVRINRNPDTAGGTDPQICDDIPTSSISVGQTKTLTCKATIPAGQEPGPSYIWAIADAGSTAGQADRTNDRAKADFTVDPPPVSDLVIRQITLNPTSGLGAKQVTISVRVANDGEASSAASKTRVFINTNADGVSTNADGVSQGDTILCDQISTVALSPGASVQVSCKPTIADRPYGVNRVWAVADATATSGQTNTENDALSAVYNVIEPPAPDLVVESLSVLPASAAPGAQVEIKARIRNQGTLGAPSTTTRIRINDSASAVAATDPIACSSIATPALAAGNFADVSCNWTIAGRSPGLAHLWAVADAGATSGEFDTANDTRTTALTVLVPDGPNLAVKRLVVKPLAARNGQGVLVKARVLNKGNAAAPASATTFRINQDATAVSAGDQVLCEDVATPALPVGESVRVRCRPVIQDRPIGPQSIWATVDSTGTGGDVDSRDNDRRVAFEVVDVVCSGTGEPTFDWPVEQPHVIQDYASYGSVPLAGGRLGYHSGIDLVSYLGISTSQLPVYAAADGEVVAIRKDCPSPAVATEQTPDGRCAAGWGNYVVLRHGGNVFSVYAHLGSIEVSEGCVEAGQRLGLAGSSGSTGLPVHVHFDVLRDMLEPVTRTGLGNEYYKRYHPFDGHVPESDSGQVQVHLDARDFMTRSRVRLKQNTTASRGRPAAGTAAYLGAQQEYISYGELVPGFVCLDLPFRGEPQDGEPYKDDLRYGWVSSNRVEVLETGIEPGSVRIDGYGAYLSDGIGGSFVSLRDGPSDDTAEVSKAWGGQQFAPSGAPVAEAGTGRLWQAIDVPGTTPVGVSGPREAFVAVDALAPAP